MSPSVRFSRDDLPALRKVVPFGFQGCRGVFMAESPCKRSGWWDDERAVWPDDAEVAAVLLPDGHLLLEGEWVTVSDDGETYTVSADKV